MFKLFGLLLGYSECCIEAFCKQEHFSIDKPSYNGFIPCKTCNEAFSREDFEKKLGRSLDNPPETYTRMTKALRGAGEVKYDKAKAVYEKDGLGEFFDRCWVASNGKLPS